MPKAIFYRYINKDGKERFGTVFSATEILLIGVKHETFPLPTGNLEYSYRKGDGVAVFGRRPIGPRRAARNRRTI